MNGIPEPSAPAPPPTGLPIPPSVVDPTAGFAPFLPKAPGAAPPPPSEEVRRATTLAVLEVAKLRRNSALAWVTTWAIFLVLVATSFAAIGCVNCSYVDAVSLLIPILAFSFLVPGGVSILFGSLSSLRWGETFRDLVAGPSRLSMAWLPGIRGAKQAWNTGRQFLWGSWILGAFTGTALLFGLTLVEETSNDAGATAAVLIALLAGFLFLRAFHHYFFAKSVAVATEELVPVLPRSYWRRNELWWSLGAFTVPLDPVVLFLISYIAASSLGFNSTELYAAVVGAVSIGGTLSMGAGGLLAYGYNELIEATRRWLRTPYDVEGRAVSMVPPEWSS